ncbi:NEL-type E3 ubiquitin ligase domain-containing protein [Pseudomonas sp. FYR_2]|uniref:NEL-type E3 ubiquitin ligase domain-containing protein n=1 Tax=unclassified Pseudomonas TaxID=196821 RepID=UPI00370C1DF0
MTTNATGHDQFMAARLPEWLKRASKGQINTLRTSLNAHHASQARLRGLTVELLPLQPFAEKHLLALLDAPLPDGQAFAQLEWLRVAPRFGTLPGTLQQTYAYSQTRENGLLRLMRNFAANTSYYIGTGLVLPGSDKPLNASLDALIAACRDLDVGQKYQDELERIFHPATQAMLAADKRSGLKLATEIAALQGNISADVQIALREVVDHGKSHRQQGLTGDPMLLKALGQPVADGLLIRLRDKAGNERGIVLYLASDPRQALRFFDDAPSMNSRLASLLKEPSYRQYFTQLISIEHRAAFVSTLGKRLKDALPDLALEGTAPGGGIFTELATRQVQRVKHDARLLLVPTADADSQAISARHAQWKAAGLDLINLAGLFIPVVGALLLGQLVAQTCSDVFEGIRDWSSGHQHEALEHLLGVAETLAATAATVAAVSFVRSAFVARLEPVSLGNGRGRLWHFDPANYRSMPGSIGLLEEGRYGEDARRWVRIDGRYHEVHQPVPGGPYRLRHAAGEGGYGPVVLHNGERGWCLMREQPLGWQDPARMLDALWPQHPAVDAHQAEQILRVADMDEDELRAVLVENRAAPVNLGQTLRAFQAHARIQTFFERVRLKALMPSDSELLTWSEGRPDVGVGLEPLLAHEAELRPQLFAHLTDQPLVQGPLSLLVKRDFPGLPAAYINELVGQAGELEHEMARVEQRLPLSCAKHARSLLRLARLNRGLAGLYLSTAYSDVTGELALALLDSFELDQLDIDLRDSALDGRSVKHLGSGGQSEAERVLVRHEGRFQVYNGLGEQQAAPPGEPGCIFEALVAALTSEQRAAMQLTGSGLAGQLRTQLLERLPGTHWGIARMLGWPEQGAWFNPGRRLEDGRVGYTLSGRASAAPRDERAIARNQLRSLYPGLDEAALDVELARLQESAQPVLERLVALQDDHDQLMQHLNRWVSAELGEGRQAARRLTADSILRAWRLQGEPVSTGQAQTQEQRLSLSGLHLRTLPELPPQIDFHRITLLSVNDTLVTDIPVDFLRPFTALTHLNLNNNGLMRMPTGLAYLPGIQALRLARNQLRLDAQAIGILHGLPNLTLLDLSYNRLEALDMSFDQLSRLKNLNLRHCRLGAWPRRLELCGLLECADLRDNQLREVPAQIQQMPHAFRRSILIERNPLSSMQLRRFYALDVIEEHRHSPEPSWTFDLARTRTLLAEHDDTAVRATREALWQRLLAQANSSGFFRLLARLEMTADYTGAGDGRVALVDGVWVLLGALDNDPVLCRRIFERADAPLSCSDAVASRFSELRVQASQAQAEANAVNPESGNQLLELGRQLFRLDQVEGIARQDYRQRLAAGEPVDELALGLAYRIRLRSRLQLPGQPYAMRYPDAVTLAQARIEDAFRRVNHAQILENLADSLSQRAFWNRYLRQQHGRMFDAIRADYSQRLLRLQAQRPALSATALEQQQTRLREQQGVDIERLVVALTQSYLRAAERGQG